MEGVKKLGIFALLCLMISCVTVNIYFPAAVAERVADQIIEDVWNIPDAKSDKDQKQTPSPESKRQSHAAQLMRGNLARLISAALPAAYAQAAPDFNASSPEIERLKAAMSARFGKMRPYFDSGAVGLTSNGLVAMRDVNAVPLAERASVNTLIQQENSDRNALYTAIAAANKHPEWRADIQKTFAQRWIAQAKSGWWYQGAGGWQQK